MHAARLLLFTLVFTSFAQTPEMVVTSQRAKQAMAAGKFSEAARLYESLVRALPDNPGLRMNLALALHSGGRYRDAITHFQAVLKQQPDMHAARLMLALAYLKIDEPANAIPELQAYLKTEPNNQRAHLELADALLKTGRHAEAVQQFQPLTNLDEFAARAWQGIGLSYVAVSRAAFAALEKNEPASVYTDILFARSLVVAGRHSSAFAIYRQALSKAPSLRGIHAGLAEVYRKTGHADWAAIEDSRERALVVPDCSRASLECMYEAGRYEEVLAAAKASNALEANYWKSLAASKLADAAFDRLSAMPPSAVTYDLLADAFRIQGKFDNAAEEWKKALALAPEDRRLKKNLGVALSLSGKHDEAESLFNELIAAEPQWPELNFQIGAARLRAGAVDQSLSYLQTAVRMSPKNTRAQATLGSALFQLGRSDEAIPHLKAAVTDDGDGSVHYQLGQAYLRTGQRALAAEALRGFNQRPRSAASQPDPTEREITAPLP